MEHGSEITGQKFISDHLQNFKVNNIITENNIVKSFNVEKCE